MIAEVPGPPAAPAGTVCPLLRFDAVVDVAGDAATIELEDSVLALRGIAPDLARAFLASCDGHTSIPEVARRTGFSHSAAESLVAQLVEAGAVAAVTAGRHDLVEPATLIGVCRRLFPRWKERVFGHTLWTSLRDGLASRALFTGWLLESYHFIEGVTFRLPSVIAACADPRVRRHFVRHFAEEYDHHRFFMASLTALGIAPDTVRRARPLPGTQAVLNWMRACGRRDPLAYAACSGFLEATGSDQRSARHFYAELSRHYDTPSGAIIGPLAQHAALDEGYRHSGFIERIALEIGPVARARADSAVEAVRGLVETIDLWSTDVERHYRTERAIPVRGVRRYRPADCGATP